MMCKFNGDTREGENIIFSVDGYPFTPLPLFFSDAALGGGGLEKVMGYIRVMLCGDFEQGIVYNIIIIIIYNIYFYSGLIVTFLNNNNLTKSSS